MKKLVVKEVGNLLWEFRHPRYGVLRGSKSYVNDFCRRHNLEPEFFRSRYKLDIDTIIYDID